MIPVVLPERYAAELELLGTGGFGQVFRSFDHQAGIPVAVKVPFRGPPEELAAAVAHELEAATRLCHPGIIQVLDAGMDDDGRHYLVMELAGSGCLDDFVTGTPPPWTELARILDETLAALGHAHAHSMIHRDIKGTNILLSRGPDGLLHPRLADFGLAKVGQHRQGADYHSTRLGAGTLLYMAPETFEDDVASIHPGADLYAFGVVLYRLLCGVAPWVETELSLILAKSQRAHRPAVLRDGLEAPAGLGGIVDRLLARQPAWRYNLAADVRRDLAALGSGGPADHAWQSVSGHSALLQRSLPAEPPSAPAAVRFPTNTAVAPVRHPILVGRETEQAQLWEVARRAAKQPTGALLVGPAGSGRSRLARWLGATLEESGLGRTLHVRFDPDTSPGEALANAVRSFLGLGRLRGPDLQRRVADHLNSRTGSDPADQGLLCGWLDPASAPVGHDADTRVLTRRLAAVERLLRSETRRGLVVVWIEDPIGSDSALPLARTLLGDASLDAFGLLVLVELPGGRIPGPELDRFTPVRLGPLAPDSMEALLRDLIPDPGFLGELIERSGGNPAFAAEAARLAVAGGHPTDRLLSDTIDAISPVQRIDPEGETRTWGADGGAVGLARARIDDLVGTGAGSSDRARPFIALGLLPSPCPAGVLDATLAAHGEPADEAARAAVRDARIAGLLRDAPEGGVTFGSAALSRAARELRVGYTGLAVQQRAAGRALLDADVLGGPVRAAELFLEAGDAAEALPLLAAAARRMLTGDLDRARATFALARKAAGMLALDRNDPAAADVTVGAARAAWRAGAIDDAASLLAATDPDALAIEQRAEWLEVRASVALLQGDHDDALRHASAAMACFAMTGDDAGGARSAAALAAALHRAGQLEDAAVAFEEARDLARDAGAEWDELDAAIRLARTLRVLGQRDRARAHLAEALQTARNLDAPDSTGVVQRELGNLALLDGDLSEAESRYREAVAQFERQGHRAEVAVTRISLGELARARGSLAQARKEYSVALGVTKTFGLVGETLVALLNLAITEIAMDRITSADRRIRAVDEQLPRSQPHRLRPFVELARMAVQAGIGDWGAAEDTLEELARMTPLPADPDALALLEKTGDLAAAATETPLALDAYDEARALAEALKDSEAVDRVTRKLATLG